MFACAMMGHNCDCPIQLKNCLSSAGLETELGRRFEPSLGEMRPVWECGMENS